MCGYTPAVKLNEVSNDRETKSEAAFVSSARSVGLSELIEDIWEEFGIYTAATIGDPYFCVSFRGAKVYFNVTLLGRELDRV